MPKKWTLLQLYLLVNIKLIKNQCREKKERKNCYNAKETMIWERSKKKENQQKQDSDMNMQIRTRPHDVLLPSLAAVISAVTSANSWLN